MTQQSEGAMRKTPLNAAHRAAGAKMVPFAGWEMPVHYGSAIEEHMATRQGCGLFDVSHMGQVFVTGRDAGTLVQAIVSRDVSRLADRQQAYGLLCDDQGRLVDDLISARMAADRWLVVVNAATRAGDVARMDEIARRVGLSGAVLEDQSDRWAMISVQGPRWAETCLPVLGEGAWQSMRPYRILETTWQGAPLIISSTGYTGERGVELICAPESAEPLWNALVAAGGRPVGLAARDSLRLEMGFCLSGQDFTADNDPFEAGLEWVVDLQKGGFGGSEALQRAAALGPRRRLMGLLPEGRRIPRHGASILDDAGQVIGQVTSGGWSPVLERPIAMGYVAVAHAKPGKTIQVDLGGGKVTLAHVTRPPFLKR
jgi:aminomethyltransferase